MRVADVAAATCDCVVPMVDSRWMFALAAVVIVVVPGIVALAARRRKHGSVSADHRPPAPSRSSDDARAARVDGDLAQAADVADTSSARTISRFDAEPLGSQVTRVSTASSGVGSTTQTSLGCTTKGASRSS